MRISCTGAKCVVTEVKCMASGAINYFTASFTFDSAWSDFISANKFYGVFEGSDSVILTTLVYNPETQTYDCDVPWETIKYQGELFVGAMGHITTPKTKILTTNMAFGYKIPEGAATNASTGSQPSGLLLEVLEAAEQVGVDADRAEAAVNHFPYIDVPTNHWFKWNAATGVFVDTGVNATGPKGEATYWYTGTAMTGTSTSNTIFSGSGITLANIKDLYLNTTTNNIYKCTLGGNASTATWIYIGNIKGATGATGAAGADASIDIVRW